MVIGGVQLGWPIPDTGLAIALPDKARHGRRLSGLRLPTLATCPFARALAGKLPALSTHPAFTHAVIVRRAENRTRLRPA